VSRTLKYKVVTKVEWVNNRLTRFALRHGFAPRAYALLETVGRRTGRPRHTPVGNGLAGDTFWLIAAHGRQADYVLNLLDNPRVRVKLMRGSARQADARQESGQDGWRDGTAVLLPEDDVQARSRMLPYKWDAALGRAIATRPVTVRVDLDPLGGRGG
jgi:deazaflavin-dependent oxidoreductase (nitroreductase family)